MDIKTGLDTAYLASSMIVGGRKGLDFLNTYVDNAGVFYREHLVNMATALTGNREFAEIFGTVAPFLVAPLFAMAIRVSTPEVLKLMFGKKTIKELTPEEREVFVSEMDLRQAEDVPASGRLSRKDAGIHFDPNETKPSGLEGKERRIAGNATGGSAYKQTGKTTSHTPPHAHDSKGRHLPT